MREAIIYVDNKLEIEVAFALENWETSRKEFCFSSSKLFDSLNFLPCAPSVRSLKNEGKLSTNYALVLRLLQSVI